MQIMNFEKTIKNLWWALTAYKTIDTLPDAFIYVDSSGFVRKANKKAYECFGFDLSGDVPVRIEDFVKSGISSVEDSVKTGKPVSAVASIPGRDFYIELSAVKIGENYCITTRDLTKLTNEIITEDKIARFNGEKNAMLVKLEGDIKSPITSITGFSQGLLDGLGGELSEKQSKYIKIINSNSNDLYNFMDKLLEFTYAESSLYEAEYQNFDIINTLKAVAKDFEPKFEQKEVVFDIDYENLEKRTVYTDMKAIQKAFSNIIDVSQSMTDTGSVSVKISVPDEVTALKFSLEPEKSYLQILIKDTGIGVPEEEMKYLCEPYAQLEKGKKNFLRALKLGSSTILIKRANGYIDITSDSMNGCEYNIVIPVEKV